MSSILIIDDDEATVYGFTQFLAKAGYKVIAASTLSDAENTLMSMKIDAILLDMMLPDGTGIDFISKIKKKSPSTAVIMVTGYGDVASAVGAMQKGADHFLTKPVDLKELDGFLRKKLEWELLKRKEAAQRRTSRNTDPFFGQSAAMKKVFDLASMASESDSILLLQGLTGTGKGVLARWIHNRGSRSAESFVEINCAGLRGDILNSELFGHVKGAFTSAVSDRQGLIEIADRGTLFLDEIGNMDGSVQAQLLKAIEERTYRRVGESAERTSDFRLICATNCDLAEEVKNGKFRSDLFYRICIFPITIPCLSERIEDITGLVRHIMEEMRPDTPAVSDDALALLRNYSWPGNIRELKNLLERALILSKGSILTRDHFPGLNGSGKPPRSRPETENLEEIERAHIQQTLDKYGGDTIKASNALGISRSSLYRKISETKVTLHP